MNICKRCGNEQVTIFYVIGETVEKGQKYCNECVDTRKLNDGDNKTDA